MGPELRTGLTSAHLVQLAFPALQDLPLLAPLPESSSTQLIVAPEAALTKLPATNGALTARTDPAPVFVRCPARWGVQVGLQPPRAEEQLACFGTGRAPGPRSQFPGEARNPRRPGEHRSRHSLSGGLDGTGPADGVHLRRESGRLAAAG